jgi:uncharacterized coiled-coil protein SlyX
MELTQTLKTELAIALAERDQADARVTELEQTVAAQAEWIEELRAKVRGLEEVEQWRQAHWNELKRELHTLQEENQRLRAQHASTHQ